MAQAAFAPGALLGGVYQIRSESEPSATGRIFEADDQVLSRRVNLKIPHDQRTAEVLLSEARVLAALSHPRLPVVHAAGRHEDIHFLVMERLVGERLDEYLARRYEEGKPLTLERVVELLGDIVGALEAIHQAGIVHRDIKPENVMICADRGTVLRDFGLVVAERRLSSDDGILHGGSPLYMAPEAASRTTEPGKGHLVDIYSLGVLAYELLTGWVPFNAGDLETLLRLHREAPIPDARMLRPNIPQELGELVTEMMAKRPGGRPQSAEEVRWRLDAIASRLARRPRGRKLLAFVVSDDLGFSMELRHRLAFWVKRAEVVVCNSGSAALAELAKQTPQLMLLDLQLGDIRALDLLDRIRKADFTPPEVVVALSERADPELLDQLRAIEVHSVIPRGKSTGAMLEPVVRHVLGAS